MRNLISTLVLLALLISPATMAQTQPPPSAPEVVEVASPAAEEGAPQVADPAPSAAVDVIVDSATDEGTPAVVIPESPEQVGQQVVQAVDDFKMGAWIAGILALIGVVLFFVNRKKPKA